MNRRIRAFWALTAAFAVATGLSVAPANAAHTPTHKAFKTNLVCPPFTVDGAGIFSSLSRMAVASAMRADQAREPDSPTTDATIPSSASIDTTNFAATIPTYVHVISKDGTRAGGDVTTKMIRDQISVLNLTFGGFYGGYDTAFKFDLKGITRTVNPAWHDMGFNSLAEKQAKGSLRQGGANTLNIYVTSASYYLGWATWPWMYKEQPSVDGIVVDFESLPGGAYGSRYGLGYTATHEVGHWLGLYHTFNTSCGGQGDRVLDTPEQMTPTSGCPEGKDTCSTEGLDPIHNYMDYSYDSCYTEYTQGQGIRMARHWLYYRAS